MLLLLLIGGNMKKDNKKIINKIFDKYGLTKDDIDKFMEIITPIYEHREFQRRMTKEFLHHGDITLGEHIIEDAVVTYMMSKNYIEKHNNVNYDLNIAVIIAMLHDLYTVPWQNNEYSKTRKFLNAHGFRHPIEAVINACSWYPVLFEDLNDAKKIIDGIVHHMFPFPVLRFKLRDKNLMELKNYELLDKIPIHVKRILVRVTSRGRIGSLSIARSKYKEGRLMSKADKRVSNTQIKDISCLLSLCTGKNKKLLSH